MAHRRERPKWLEYDWHIEGHDARFHVDMSLFDHAPDEAYGALVYLCFASMKNDMGLSGGETRKAMRRIKKLIRETGAKYAGYIDTEGQRQYYLYAASRDALDLAEELTRKLKRPSCDCGAAMEPAWQSYLHLLYPDAAKMQTLENIKYIDHMRHSGDILTAARRMNLHMYFATEPLAMMFAEQARLSGFAIGKSLFHPEYDFPHGVIIHRICPLEKRALDEVTTRAIYIAEKYEGSLIYMDCQLVPKRSPLR